MNESRKSALGGCSRHRDMLKLRPGGEEKEMGCSPGEVSPWLQWVPASYRVTLSQ